MKERPILFNAEMVRAVLDLRKTQTRRMIKPQPIQMSDFGVDNFGACYSERELPCYENINCPYGKKGDQLWAKETFCVYNDWQKIYRADTSDKRPMPGACWTPSIFMRREYSRINLKVEEVRFQRVQDISEEDAKAEGRAMPTEEDRCEKYVEKPDYGICEKCGGTGLYDGFGENLGVIPDCDCEECNTYKGLYKGLWNSINSAPSPRYRRDESGKKVISYYESYPWEDVDETQEFRGKPWHIHGNPLVWAVTFKKLP